MPSTANQTAESAYTDEFVLSVGIAEEIGERIFDRPAPDGSLNWAHVGDMAEIHRVLQVALDRITGNES